MKLSALVRRSALALAFVVPTFALGVSGGPLAEREAHAQSTGQKVGVVDVQRAVMQTEDGLRAQATLKKLFDNKQQELNRRQADLQKQKEDIDKQAKVLSKEAYSKRLEDLNKQLMELQSVFVDYNKELDKKQEELTAPIVKRLVALVAKIAREKGYDIVIDKRAAPFSRGDLDITDKVVELFNAGETG